MGSRAESKYIDVRERPGGTSAFVEGTRTRVTDVARLYKIMREDVIIERMMRSMPHLTQAQIAAALKYWRDHPDEIETEIAEEDQVAEKLSKAQ